MLLFPGFSWPGGMWRGTVDRVPEAWDVWAADLPGSGGTTWLPGDEAGPGAFLEDLATACGLSVSAASRVSTGERWLLAGYSMGGRVAWQLALGLLQHVRGVLGVSCAPGRTAAAQDPAVRQAWLEQWARRLKAGPLPEVLAAWDAQPLLAGRERAEAELWRRRCAGGALDRLLLAWADHRGTQVQGEVQVPSLLLIGAEDETYVQRTSGLASRRLVPDAGHALPWQTPDAVAQALRGLAGVP